MVEIKAQDFLGAKVLSFICAFRLVLDFSTYAKSVQTLHEETLVGMSAALLFQLVCYFVQAQNAHCIFHSSSCTAVCKYACAQFMSHLNGIN